ncbi:MAG: hypothetical protein H7249_19260 [Chitinophagaceae bacterium]|nr:hypothetical protein [Oligoflexus sp.]
MAITWNFTFVRRWPRFTKNLILFVFTLFGTKAHAQDASLYPSFLFDMRYGFITSKSKLVVSNDTGSALGYGVGAFAGQSRNIEFHLGFETDTTPYLLNKSNVSYDWQDTKLRYHYGYFYAGAVFSRLNLKVKSAGADTVDASGSGYGGSTGFLLPLGKASVFRTDISTVSISKMTNALTGTASVPSRLDIDIGASVETGWKWLDFDFGYRMRTLSIKRDKAYSDTETCTYIGLRLQTTH